MSVISPGLQAVPACRSRLSYEFQKKNREDEWLQKNNLGSEIIFDEMQEVKDVGEKLSLKNWKELLKGKLFDLATDKVGGFGVEAAKSVFKIFTGEDINKFLN